MTPPDNLHLIAAHLRSGTETLAETNLRLRRQLEAAELLIPRLNDMLNQLHCIRLTEGTTVVGRVILQQAYTSPCAADSGLVFQAALVLPGGIGVLAVDSEEYVLHEANPILAASDQPRRFEPFCECSSAVKALLFPEAHELLRRLFNIVAIAGS